LAQKSQESGYHPEIILAGRRLNDSMGEFVASQVIKLMIKKSIPINGAKILLLGFTFKENCPDVRNTKIIDVIMNLKDYSVDITTYDPWANPAEVMHEYNIQTTQTTPNEKFDAIVLGVSHNEFLSLDLNNFKHDKCVVFDVKGILDRSQVDGRL
jgi:UDP-N-acetyl-D-galactosamine dehydrogenase